MTYTIREYRADDLGGVMSSWEHANALAHSFLPKEFVDQVRQDIPALYLPNAETWVADCNGTIVGFIALIGNEIGAVFVEPEFHNTGIGTALVNKAQELRGELEVEVFELNAIGRKFYSKYGFKRMGENLHAGTGNTVLRLKLTT
ncbi:GNAT family N-acetyltransferase [Spirulina major CS-329]|uniref:GNAT family N-acetyltransferase n=1 Tax=Spirulina TaxID=1154 RepID=UPI00232D89DF|nr:MULTISPECIES: GNAT family N-acetyltransferase [Spirulina]MDB9493327.1 GNAT family N-acetyltransferase [Spirulina subsalsa CS-330]MDB9502496.1 GNAT family N-acetyltransferase [Spirulina major CS-329]